jgi:hypothetical protein
MSDFVQMLTAQAAQKIETCAARRIPCSKLLMKRMKGTMLLAAFTYGVRPAVLLKPSIVDKPDTSPRFDGGHGRSSTMSLIAWPDPPGSGPPSTTWPRRADASAQSCPEAAAACNSKLIGTPAAWRRSWSGSAATGSYHPLPQLFQLELYWALPFPLPLDLSPFL